MEEWIRKYFEEVMKEVKRIREEMARIESEIFRPLVDLERKSIEPLYEIHRYSDKIQIYVDLPGVKDKNDINLQLLGNKLILEAKLAKPYSMGDLTVLRGEEFTQYRLEIGLPENIITEQIKARFRNGILEITVPLKVEKYKINIE
ncbi:MAG: hypothetical protein DRJ35_04405 [Thermoprotei archaeon]|nr:MAG: hypothetical protein DRJ35_04405 [Thermoprotei archaeon]